jgi:5-formyltetrahydrofolate cyclo-ligase
MKREKLSAPVAAKEEVRRKMRATLRSMAPEKRAQASLEMCRLAAALPVFFKAKTVALFAPLTSEPDIHPLIEEAWARDKRVVFPLMLRDGDVPSLQWHQVKSWDEMIVVGPFAIREPDPIRCPLIEAKALELVFVPGLAFDKGGLRLGRGGGYYDSALVKLPAKTARIGLMFACQQVPEVPREPHDEALKNILTEDGLTR